MEKGILTTEKDAGFIREAINRYVVPRGFKEIRANIEDFETPSRLSRGQQDDAFIPDITGKLNGRKSYFELALKTDKVSQVVTKWKLLSKIAGFKQGKFVLLVPNGHLAFTNRLLKKYPLEAKVVKI